MRKEDVSYQEMFRRIKNALIMQRKAIRAAAWPARMTTRQLASLPIIYFTFPSTQNELVTLLTKQFRAIRQGARASVVLMPYAFWHYYFSEGIYSEYCDVNRDSQILNTISRAQGIAKGKLFGLAYLHKPKTSDSNLSDAPITAMESS